MDFRFANLKRVLFVAGMAIAVSFAQAQSVMKPGQPIIFSAPDSDGGASNAPSLSAPSPMASGLPDASQAPVFNFNVMPPGNANLPAPQAMQTSPSDFARLQKLLDERKNWALLTPAEVLGIPTPEKILGLQERDAAGQEKNLTVAERYYERQNQLQAGRTNNYQNDPASRWNLPNDRDDRLNGNNFNSENGNFGNPERNADSFFNGNTPDNDNAASSQKSEAGAGDFFAAPTRLTQAETAAETEQQAEMERFRQLLDPPQPVAAAKVSSARSVFSTPQTAPDSFFGQTPANPISGSFTPLSSGISGVPTVPVAPGQNNTPPITVTPSWTPQPPPWMSQTPQLGVIPQRKF
jgi:hypothetical protein